MKNKKEFNIAEILVIITIFILIIALIFALIITAIDNSACNNGDIEACKKINKVDYEEKKECDIKKNKCNYDCAITNDINLDDCIKRCKLKYNYCLK